MQTGPGVVVGYLLTVDPGDQAKAIRMHFLRDLTKAQLVKSHPPRIKKGLLGR